MEVLRELLFKFRFGFSIRDSLEMLLTSIAALYFVGGVRVTFSIGIGTGGPAAYWCVV